jgi:catechol 2,3-dioxygenase-like lactoylglutathione lyase family enzyme
MTATRSSSQLQSLADAREIVGMVCDVGDLAATEAFYGPILRHAGGEWEGTPEHRQFGTNRHVVSFLRREGPQVSEAVGRHQAYRVPADSIETIVKELAALGYAADWWHEDHPSERAVSAYLLDPDGNRVQVVPSTPEELKRLGFIDHVGIEVHDLESAEVFYEKVLGGRIDYYHGRRALDYQAALAWQDGGDPCAPWTRLWPGAGLSTDPRHKSHVPHPNQQVYFRFGDSRLALFLAGKHRQEPPEDQALGAPRVVLESPLSAATIAERLAKPPISLTPEDRLPLTFQVDGPAVYLRDPGANFVEINSGQMHTRDAR